MSTREIVQGDTLSAIAAELGVTLDELLEANPQFAGNPDLILPGQQVAIPGGTSEESDATESDTTSDDGVSSAEDPATANTTGQEGAPTQVGTVTIPDGGRLVSIRGPSGSDNPREYYIIYSLYGLDVAYRVGGQDRMDELFPAGGLATFESYRGFDSQQAFDQAGFTIVGEIDEQLGATESIQSQFERDLRAQGLESLPSWILNDQQAMSTLVVAANEGWSEGRTWKQLQQTDGFSSRFPGMASFMGRNQLDDVRSAVAEYVGEEDRLRAQLQQHRGANTNTDSTYLGSLIGAGWTATEAASVLEGEARLHRNPEALQQFQQLMALQGQEVGVEDFLNVFRGQASPDVLEVLNDTFRFQELAEAGLDIDATFAQFLGDGASTRLVGESGFTESAQAAAQAVLRFGMELDAEKFGLTRDDIISAAFGQTSPTGRSAAETNDLLARFGRDRAERAKGLAGFQAFVNQRNRLQVAGLG